MSKPDGGPAFPSLRRYVSPNTYETLADGGMSLRDWFAGQALGGLLADDDSVDRMADMGDDLGVHEVETVVAVMAYKMADAMIAERGRP